MRCLASNPINNAFVQQILVTKVADSIKGKPRSLMQLQPLADVHLFTPTMKQWRHSIKVDCGPDWSWDTIKAAIEHSPYSTACTSDANDLFKEDITYQITAGFQKGCAVGRRQAFTSKESQNLLGGSHTSGGAPGQDNFGPFFPRLPGCQQHHNGHTRKC